MKIDQVGQIVYNQDNLCDLLMQGSDLSTLNGVLVDNTVDLETAAVILEDIPTFIRYDELAQVSVKEFDHRCQNTWYMPQKYKDLDIAEHVLSLCASDAELQRCGAELLLFQERDLFDLLRYLVYLVDTMRESNLIWGVGRGSSVASYVLYKLGVHRIDSLFYDLDPSEFLR
jgi:DNA polymerase III alpha subunit